MTKAEIAEYLKTDEGEEMRRFIDGRVTEAVKTFADNHPRENTEELRGLLAEKDREITRLKTETVVSAECQRLGIPLEMIEKLGVTFSDESEVTARLETVAELLEKDRVKSVNARLRLDSYTPGSGATEEDRPDLATLSPVRAAFLEELGELDGLIEQ